PALSLKGDGSVEARHPRASSFLSPLDDELAQRRDVDAIAEDDERDARLDAAVGTRVVVERPVDGALRDDERLRTLADGRVAQHLADERRGLGHRDLLHA